MGPITGIVSEEGSSFLLNTHFRHHLSVGPLVQAGSGALS